MITIVSGLPRSGTSMMMQMLEAGGLPVLTDSARTPDADNPRGYYELEKVKTINQDASWLAQAEGKALKVVSMLLYGLPPERQYKVIFMTRAIGEIIASQSRMLDRAGQKPDGPDGVDWAGHFEAHLSKVKSWLKNQPNMEAWYCDYQAVITDPRREALAIAGFLGIPLEVAAMARVVDPSLHRVRCC